MAIARCLEHAPQNRKINYSHYVEPVNHPKSGLICGKNSCEKPAFIFLDSTDLSSFNNGSHIFGLPNTEQAKFEAKTNSKLKPHLT